MHHGLAWILYALGIFFSSSFSYLTLTESYSHQQIEARRKKKVVVEDSDSDAEDGAGSSSLTSNSAGDGCTIIDDELEEELKKLGDLEPLERQLIRLEGLEPYVLVSVLTATASYSTITSEEFITDGVIDWTGAGLLASALGSTLCGLYSTIIFSLSILYGKTALGANNVRLIFRLVSTNQRLFACTHVFIPGINLQVRVCSLFQQTCFPLVLFKIQEWTGRQHTFIFSKRQL